MGVLKAGYAVYRPPIKIGGVKGSKGEKGGKHSRKLLSENEALPPDAMRKKCGPVYICVPDKKVDFTMCAAVKCAKPKCKRDERLIPPNPKQGNCCGKCVANVNPCPKSPTTCPVGQELPLKSKVTRKRRIAGLRAARRLKAGKRSRRLLHEDLVKESEKIKCPPVYVCVPKSEAVIDDEDHEHGHDDEEHGDDADDQVHDEQDDDDYHEHGHDDGEYHDDHDHDHDYDQVHDEQDDDDYHEHGHDDEEDHDDHDHDHDNDQVHDEQEDEDYHEHDQVHE